MVKLSTPRPVKAVVTAPSRTWTTVYQNTTGRPLLVIVTVECVRIAGTDLSAYALAQMGTTTACTDFATSAGLMPLTTTVTEDLKDVIILPVPNNYYYKVTRTYGTGCSVILAGWLEVEL